MQRSGLVFLIAFDILASCILAADMSPELIVAAKRGQTEKVAAMLAKGSPVDVTDKDGRTALMLAAMRGHASIVEELLKHGAKADTRDRLGWTAFGLAVFSTANGRDAVLKALPARPPLRLMLEAGWTPENLVTSCFLRPAQLREQVAAVQPDAQMAAALRNAVITAGKRFVELVPEGGDATLRLTVRPGVSCVQQQSADNVTELVDVRFTAAEGGAALLEKTFGGGLKGLHARAVTSPAQYGVTFEEWAKAHGTEIYSAALEAWLKRQ
jgi:ankyrin repeat protein